MDEALDESRPVSSVWRCGLDKMSNKSLAGAGMLRSTEMEVVSLMRRG